MRPDTDTGNATQVQVDLVLNSIGPVNDMDMEISASVYLRQQWMDKRLAHNVFNRSIVISYKHLDELWVPDLFFPQSKTERRHVLTTPNILIRLETDGSILYSQRLSVTLQCFMELHNFPLDYQKCAIEMESYSYSTDQLYFIWSLDRGSLNVQDNAFIPDFTIIDVTSNDCTSTYATGSFTCLKAEVALKREIGFYITQTYIPSILIVILSWASFWIDHEAVPARISVGLLTVLTITTQSSGARSQLPRVPYIKSIDVWMAVCLVFVFGAYMEYAVVTVLSRRHRKAADKRSKSEVSLNGVVIKNGTSDISSNTTDKTNEVAHPGRTVDKRSRILFPLAFLIFNLVYWIYYIHGPK
ncbi:glycine receptor subunit alpha-2 isoform X2 [Patella vulgata]|nr:glycine receptor subunit alpha-2 isoform X2 [Patella vulgata]